jgi:hypothetical protein
VRSALVRFYGSLNNCLPAPRRQATLVCAFESSPSVKDFVEAFGVPHPEIDLLTVDGQPVDFSYRLRDGDRGGSEMTHCERIRQLGLTASRCDPICDHRRVHMC